MPTFFDVVDQDGFEHSVLLESKTAYGVENLPTRVRLLFERGLVPMQDFRAFGCQIALRGALP